MKLLELYQTVQGEGPNVGKRTVFIRFAGCNMRCPGWPCDTPYSIDPDIWRHEFKETSPKELFLQLQSTYPDVKHACITGGEPLLQKTDELNSLFSTLSVNRYTVDLFTNGSRKFDNYYLPGHAVTIIMDWKLAGSGEGTSFRDVREKNLLLLTRRDAVKFVVKDRNDLHEAKQLIELWKGRTDLSDFRVYFSPAWGLIEPSEIVQFMQDYRLEDTWLNLQTHKMIWEPSARMI